jgi:hypothetical protein
MTTAKNLGIWMDHSNAHIMALTAGPMETTIIESKFTHGEKQHSLGSSENLMHHKEQHQQSAYYKRLGEIIKNYEEVILFGPTNAKVELFNTLRADRQFANIKIEVRQTDKLTENQQHAFVRDHFLKS